MVLYPLLPETPYWLVLNDNLGDAEAVLQRMARINGVPLPQVTHKFKQLKPVWPCSMACGVVWSNRSATPCSIHLAFFLIGISVTLQTAKFLLKLKT